MQFGPLTLKRCKYGWMLYSGPYIGKCFDLYGQYSESEVLLMRQFLRAGGTAIDIGANIGDLTVPMALAVGEAGKIYAVESHPEIFNVLCANLALNQIQNTMPINAFVSSSTRPDTSSPVWGKSAYVGNRWATRFIAIDDLDLDALDLLKVDVDGKELEVLQSGAMQIERFRPVLYFENDVKEASAALLEFLLADLGYDLFWHPAPIFETDNFFDNPVNAWAPRQIASLMVVGLPRERGREVPGLRKIQSKDEWWDALA